MKTISIAISLMLILALTSCSQTKVNEDRLPSGITPGGTSGVVDDDNISASGPSTEENQNPEDKTDGPSIPGANLGPAGSDFPELEGNTLEDSRPGWGTIRYSLDTAVLYDGLEAAGISEESYALSGERGYDHYIKVEMTVENVDVSDIGTTELISNIELMSKSGAVIENIAPVWFSLGGEAEKDAKRYFAFLLPEAGGSIEVELAFGLDDETLSRVQEADGLWMVNNISQTMIKLEGVV